MLWRSIPGIRHGGSLWTPTVAIAWLRSGYDSLTTAMVLNPGPSERCSQSALAVKFGHYDLIFDAFGA